MSIVPTANSNNASSSNSSTQATANPLPTIETTNNNNNSNPSKSSKEDISNQSPSLVQQPFSNLSVSALSSTFINKSPRSPVPSNIKHEASKSSSSENSTQYELQESLKQQQAKNKSNAVVYDDINIFMWSVCKICNKSSKKFAMSPHTWSFSLAKYLELTFHAKNYHQFNGEDSHVVCTHSLFQDHYQYFRFSMFCFGYFF
jgi:hypothetical protein